MKRFLLLNGPNINRLGKREKDVYGTFTLQDIEENLRDLLKEYSYELESKQSNIEGELVSYIQQADDQFAGIIFNPAAYTHTSIALRDAISSISIPVVEVHISNVYERESFRHQSMTAPVSLGQITGFGLTSYRLGAMALLEHIERK
ncbi:MAG TPA: type II 3-dehydroquinate dehydratase [Bacillota bacterium]|nr:type II 3-dehydroquinate dehydratase [Bacillota bacterium]